MNRTPNQEHISSPIAVISCLEQFWALFALPANPLLLMVYLPCAGNKSAERMQSLPAWTSSLFRASKSRDKQDGWECGLAGGGLHGGGVAPARKGVAATQVWSQVGGLLPDVGRSQDVGPGDMG